MVDERSGPPAGRPDLLDLLGVDDHLDARALRSLWNSLGGDPFTADEVADAARDAVERAGTATTPRDGAAGGATATADGAPTGAGPDDGLDLRLGNWTLDLRRATIRTAVMSALLAGALADQGLTGVSVGLITAIIPSVLDIERVELSPGDRRLVLDLRLRPWVRNQALTEDELYLLLPVETRETVNRYDFADAIGRLRELGVAEVASTTADGTERLALQDPDRRPFLRWH